MVCCVYAALPDMSCNNTRLLTCQPSRHLLLMNCSLKPYVVIKQPYYRASRSYSRKRWNKMNTLVIILFHEMKLWIDIGSIIIWSTPFLFKFFIWSKWTFFQVVVTERSHCKYMPDDFSWSIKSNVQNQLSKNKRYSLFFGILSESLKAIHSTE